MFTTVFYAKPQQGIPVSGGSSWVSRFQFPDSGSIVQSSRLEDHRERPQKYYPCLRTRRSDGIRSDRNAASVCTARRTKSADRNDGPFTEGARLSARRIVGKHLFRRDRSRLGCVGLREGAEQSESHSD